MLTFTLQQGMKVHWGARMYSSAFSVAPARDVGGRATLRPLYPLERDLLSSVQETGWAPGPLWIVAENLADTGFRSPDRLPSIKSLYRLQYPASNTFYNFRLHLQLTFRTHEVICDKMHCFSPVLVKRCEVLMSTTTKMNTVMCRSLR